MLFLKAVTISSKGAWWSSKATYVLPSNEARRRAMPDIEEIRRYSVEQWGKRVADEYLDSIEEALVRLRENTNLLRIKAEFSRHLRFYRVRRHFLVCSLIRTNTYLATLLPRRSRNR